MEELEIYLEKSLMKSLSSSALINKLLEKKGVSSSYMSLLVEKNELLETLEKGENNEDRRRKDDYRRFINLYNLAKSFELSEECLPSFSLITLFLSDMTMRPEAALLIFAIGEISEYLPEVFSETDYFTEVYNYEARAREVDLLIPLRDMTEKSIDEETRKLSLIHYRLYEKVMDNLEAKLRADKREDLLVFFEDPKSLVRAVVALPLTYMFGDSLTFRNLLKESIGSVRYAKETGIYKQRIRLNT